MHEDPQVPNFGPPDRGPRLMAGQVLAIEPMVTLGSPEVGVLADAWTRLALRRVVAIVSIGDVVKARLMELE